MRSRQKCCVCGRPSWKSRGNPAEDAFCSTTCEGQARRNPADDYRLVDLMSARSADHGRPVTVKCDGCGKDFQTQTPVVHPVFCCEGCLDSRQCAGHCRMVPRAEGTRGNPSMSPMLRGYVECALWSETDNSTPSGGDPFDKNYTADDIEPASLAKMAEDVQKFADANADDIADSGLSDQRVGHNFWLSRNGHGLGFFDENSVDSIIRDRLQDAARHFGESNLLVDDGVLYIFPPPAGAPQRGPVRFRWNPGKRYV